MGLKASEFRVAAVHDPLFGASGQTYVIGSSHLGFAGETAIRLKDIRGLDVGMQPVLVPTFSIDFSGEFIGDLRGYVRRGGTLLFVNGLPLYRDIRPEGSVAKIGDRHMKEFHIAWEAPWTDTRVPEEDTSLPPAEGFDGADFETLMGIPVGRTLTAKNVAGGDRFIPVENSVSASGYSGVVVALYQMDCDLKGNTLDCREGKETVSEEVQAQLLPRSYLVALPQGVERLF